MAAAAIAWWIVASACLQMLRIHGAVAHRLAVSVVASVHARKMRSGCSKCASNADLGGGMSLSGGGGGGGASTLPE